MPAADPIRDKRQLKQMAGYYLKRGQIRNHAIIILGVHTALRVSDLLRLRWADVCDELSGQFRTHLTITEQKTSKAKTIALNKQAVAALRRLYPFRRSDYIFASNRKDGRAISRVQAYRIIRAAAVAVGIVGIICCHSLRKTFGYHAWQNGAPAVVIMDIYNHSSYEMTRRYLGISQEDRDSVYLKMALF